MTDRPAHLGIRHLALHTRAFEAMRQFYTALLGFRVEWEPDPDNVYLTSGTDNLALHRSKDPAAARETTLDHMGLLVRAAEDVDQWAAFLGERGVTLVAAPRTHRDGARSCYVRDPDGNLVQIIHHPPISTA